MGNPDTKKFGLHGFLRSVLHDCFRVKVHVSNGYYDAKILFSQAVAFENTTRGVTRSNTRKAWMYQWNGKANYFPLPQSRRESL